MIKKILIISPPLSKKGGVSIAALKINKIKSNRFQFAHYSTGFGYFDQVIRFLVFALSFKCSGYDFIHTLTGSGRSFYRKLPYVLLSLILKRKIVLHVHGGRFIDFASSGMPFVIIKFLINFNSIKFIFLGLKYKLEFDAIFNDGKKTGILSNFEFNDNVFDLSDLSVGAHMKICFAGRMVESKGIDKLVEAVSLLNKEEVSLSVYGDGPLFGLLSSKFSIYSNIEFMGWVDSSCIQYNKFHLLVLPSTIEAMPLTVIEAMSFGTPALATSIGLVPSMIDHGSTGFLIDDNSVQSLVDAIKAIDIEILLAMRPLVLKNFHSRFSSDSFLSQCELIYAF